MELTVQHINTAITQQEAEKIIDYARAAKSENTVRGYVGDMKRFISWCKERNLEYLPAETDTAIRFIVDMADTMKVSTLERYISSINVIHKSKGYPRPARIGEMPFKDIWAGIVRRKGRWIVKKEALLIEDLRKICSVIPNDLAGTRDKAIILFGFASACRRSELEAAKVEHIQFTDEGIKFRLPRSKWDQQGYGMTKGIGYGDNEATCPVIAIKNWLERSGIEEGSLFRGVDRHCNIRKKGITAHSISLIIKKRIENVGMDSSKYGAHSLRSGFCTQAARAGVPEYLIMRHTGHQSLKTMRGYIQAGEIFTETPTTKIGL